MSIEESWPGRCQCACPPCRPWMPGRHAANSQTRSATGSSAGVSTRPRSRSHRRRAPGDQWRPSLSDDAPGLCISIQSHGQRLNYNTHTCLPALCPGPSGRAGTTRKVKPIWILLKQETVSGSDISWAICKSAPRSRQITMPAPHRSVFYRPGALPATQPTASKHWRHELSTTIMIIKINNNHIYTGL